MWTFVHWDKVKVIWIENGWHKNLFIQWRIMDPVCLR